MRNARKQERIARRTSFSCLLLFLIQSLLCFDHLKIYGNALKLKVGIVGDSAGDFAEKSQTATVWALSFLATFTWTAASTYPRTSPVRLAGLSE